MARSMDENSKLYRARIARLIAYRPADPVGTRWARPAVEEHETLHFAGPYLHSGGASQALGRARTRERWSGVVIEEKSYVEVFDPQAGVGWVKKPCVCR